MIFLLDNSFNGRKIMKITAAVARTVFATGSESAVLLLYVME